MQVSPLQAAVPGAAQTGAAAGVRVLAGNLAAVPVGELLQATVTTVTAGEATLTVNGQSLTVKPPTGMQPGNVLLVRVPNGGQTPSLDVLGRAPTQTPQPADTPAVPPRTALVDVVKADADGRVQVRIDGRAELATTAERLVPGNRYVLQVEPSPAGITLRLPPESPTLPTDVAAAVLRGARPPDIGATVKPLLAELAALQPNPAAPRGEPATPVQQAAAAVRAAVATFLPTEGQSPTAEQLQNLVENGGLHHEAKVARLLPETSDTEVSPPADRPPPSPLRTPGPDLKEGLLRLLQAAHDIGTATQLPAAQAALDGIEAQQAANVFAQEQGTPYVLQVPFPDGREWRTLHLAVEAERTGRERGTASDGFRMLMHVPLADLGETWIDAGLSGNRLRAVVYLESAAARDRVRAELPGLRTELLGDGFAAVLLDVRPAADLPARQRQQGTAMRSGRAGGGSVLDVRA